MYLGFHSWLLFLNCAGEHFGSVISDMMDFTFGQDLLYSYFNSVDALSLFS